MFTIPNEDDATYEAQARVSSVDLQAIVSGISRTGVVSGMAVSASTGRDFDISSGVYEINGIIVSSGAKTGTIGAGDATHPRIDIINVDSDGSLRIATGTPAADPVAPNVAVNRVVLASIYVPAGMATLLSDMVGDRRVFLVDVEMTVALINAAIQPIIDALDAVDFNNFATDAELATAVTTAIAALVDMSPDALNTLNELAAALGDDPNFAATITALINTKVPQTRQIAGLDLSANRSDADIVAALAASAAPIISRSPRGLWATPLAAASSYPSYTGGGHGLYPGAWTGTNGTSNAGAMILGPAQVYGTISLINLFVATAPSVVGADLFRFCVYAPDANGWPMTKLSEISVAMSAIAVNALTTLTGLSLVVPEGSWVGHKLDGAGSITYRQAASTTGYRLPLHHYQNSNNGILYNIGASTVPPASLAAVTKQSTNNAMNMTVRGV